MQSEVHFEYFINKMLGSTDTSISQCPRVRNGHACDTRLDMSAQFDSFQQPGHGFDLTSPKIIFFNLMREEQQSKK